MAKVLVSESSLQGIANAIRSKNGSSQTYFPGEMAQAILNLPLEEHNPVTVNITQSPNQTISVNCDPMPNSLPAGTELTTGYTFVPPENITLNATVTPASGYRAGTLNQTSVTANWGTTVSFSATSATPRTINISNAFMAPAFQDGYNIQQHQRPNGSYWQSIKMGFVFCSNQPANNTGSHVVITSDSWSIGTIGVYNNGYQQEHTEEARMMLYRCNAGNYYVDGGAALARIRDRNPDFYPEEDLPVQVLDVYNTNQYDHIRYVYDTPRSNGYPPMDIFLDYNNLNSPVKHILGDNMDCSSYPYSIFCYTFNEWKENIKALVRYAFADNDTAELFSVHYGVGAPVLEDLIIGGIHTLKLEENSFYNPNLSEDENYALMCFNLHDGPMETAYTQTAYLACNIVMVTSVDPVITYTEDTSGPYSLNDTYSITFNFNAIDGPTGGTNFKVRKNGNIIDTISVPIILEGESYSTTISGTIEMDDISNDTIVITVGETGSASYAAVNLTINN